MLKRICFVILLAGFCASLVSCETTKGVAKDVENTADNVVDGYKALKRADERMQEVLW